MRPTVPYLLQRFTHFNNLCFKGMLRPLPIRLNNSVRTAGKMRTKAKQYSIEISTRLDLPAEEYDRTLVHEMIHYFIASNGMKDDAPHGRLFRAKMEELNQQYGLGITIRFTPEQEMLSQSTSVRRIICVMQLCDGRTGLAVVARSRVFQLWNAYLSDPRIEYMQWYSSNCAFFQQFRTLRTAGYYIVDDEVVRGYLEGAIELVREGEVIKKKS